MTTIKSSQTNPDLVRWKMPTNSYTPEDAERDHVFICDWGGYYSSLSANNYNSKLFSLISTHLISETADKCRLILQDRSKTTAESELISGVLKVVSEFLGKVFDRPYTNTDLIKIYQAFAKYDFTVNDNSLLSNGKDDILRRALGIEYNTEPFVFGRLRFSTVQMLVHYANGTGSGPLFYYCPPSIEASGMLPEIAKSLAVEISFMLRTSANIFRTTYTYDPTTLWLEFPYGTSEQKIRQGLKDFMKNNSNFDYDNRDRDWIIEGPEK